MAATVVSCKRLVGQGEQSAQSSNGETDTAVYQVEILEDNATPFEVRRAEHANMPAYDSVHPIEPKIKVVNKTVKRVKDKAKNYWEVTVFWDKPTQDKNEWGDTPNSKNITVRVSGQETALLTQKAADENNTPIRNAVGDLYPDPIEIVVYDEMITVDYEATTLNMSLVASLRGKINDDVVTLTLPQGSLFFTRSFAKHTLLLKTVDYSVTYSKSNPTQSVWSVSCTLLYREDTWNIALPQKGYRWLVDDKLTEWKDHAEYLTADGTKLGDGEEIVSMDPVQRYTEADLLEYLSGI